MAINGNPVPGVEYTLKEIDDEYKPDPSHLYYVLFKGDKIVALRLRQDYNKLLLSDRPQLWVGQEDKATRDWGRILAKLSTEVPIYLKKDNRDKYTYLGVYEVVNDDDRPESCEAVAEQVPHKRGISRIVFLRKK
jgi:hypothetical protein